MNSFVIKLCQISGKQISIGEPIVNATMPDGSRLQATLGFEITARVSSFTIRKFREDPFTPVDMIKMGTCGVDMMVYLWMGIENNKNMLFAGGTASGKTTMLNAVSLFLPFQAKVVSIEDTRELVLHNDNWISALTRDSFMVGGLGEISMFELLKTAMRQRPEYLIVGEVRGEEALTLFQAMSTGHASYSTIHAGDLPDVINRLESEPINVPHSMLQALDILCLQVNIVHKDKRVRRTRQIVEITGLDPITENIRINEIFRWNPVHDNFKPSSNSYIFNLIMQERG
ncbi:MAG: type II/IV secretion system ATPase subunit [ANME-2 cluster archaeon]|nr:type II/IV secretion system ATPase subunit [ANME-2 cluster archaeon]